MGLPVYNHEHGPQLQGFYTSGIRKPVPLQDAGKEGPELVHPEFSSLQQGVYWLARMIPKWQHCLSEDHTSASCLHHPNPMVAGWLQLLGTLKISPQPLSNLITPAPASRTPGKPQAQEVSRIYNNSRCHFTRCWFAHTCSDCVGSHAAVHCPQKLMA